MRELLAQAVTRANELLRDFGIVDEHVVVKIRPMKTSNEWLACYRSRSQFRSRPIIWVNPDFARLCRENACDPLPSLIDTLLHEYGHVVYEFAALREPALFTDIDAISEDEEDFAETFALVVRKNAASPTYRKIAAAYNQALHGG